MRPPVAFFEPVIATPVDSTPLMIAQPPYPASEPLILSGFWMQYYWAWDYWPRILVCSTICLTKETRILIRRIDAEILNLVSISIERSPETEVKGSSDRLESFPPNQLAAFVRSIFLPRRKCFPGTLSISWKLLWRTNTIWIIECSLTCWQTFWVKCSITLPCITFWHRPDHLHHRASSICDKWSNRKFRILKCRTAHTREAINLCNGFTCISILRLFSISRRSKRRTTRTNLDTIYTTLVFWETVSLIEIDFGISRVAETVWIGHHYT